ncbi:hypothetical protein HYPSUDRAFT_62709 [Hypholoma sublateritium FD-334 SS-4]|uniref:Uncharacterized protein n=1 Tax=Hypholoma sublateritium (strain FD-334 SS-4) TaxID=945553 RepID=A0A0D2LJ51_HYPSF|nr:hypothetical protein HYPSUDRAFT_62709 [Hypholoma sublateritium FD-334 SS-4]
MPGDVEICATSINSICIRCSMLRALFLINTSAHCKTAVCVGSVDLHPRAHPFLNRFVHLRSLEVQR